MARITQRADATGIDTGSDFSKNGQTIQPGHGFGSANRSLYWFNPNAFVAPGQYKFGNAGRNILRGPRFSDVDFSAAKTLMLPKLENGQLQFRFDATNALNHTSLGIPNINIGASTVGQITGAALSGRTLQLGARMSF